jgi:hypothetical protein
VHILGVKNMLYCFIKGDIMLAEGSVLILGLSYVSGKGKLLACRAIKRV